MTGETPIAFQLAPPSHTPDPNRFESDPEARAQHIHEMVGIMPDRRYHVPVTETTELIRGTQAGDNRSSERLVATRLDWLYKDFARREPIRQRVDLELEDVMQIGCLATLKAARRIDFGNPTPVHVQLRLFTPRIAESLIMEHKLVPTINSNTDEPSYSSCQPGDTKRLLDKAIPVDDETLRRQIERRRDIPPSSNENEVLTKEFDDPKFIDSLLAGLNRNEVMTLVWYYGLDGRGHRSLAAIAPMLGGRARSTVAWFKKEGLEKLAQSEALRALEPGDLLSDDFTNHSAL